MATLSLFCSRSFLFGSLPYKRKSLASSADIFCVFMLALSYWQASPPHPSPLLMTYADVDLVLLVRVHCCGCSRCSLLHAMRLTLGGRASGREGASWVVLTLCSVARELRARVGVTRSLSWSVVGSRWSLGSDVIGSQGQGELVRGLADFQRVRLEVEEARACLRRCCLTTQNVDVC